MFERIHGYFTAQHKQSSDEQAPRHKGRPKRPDYKKEFGENVSGDVILLVEQYAFLQAFQSK